MTTAGSENGVSRWQIAKSAAEIRALAPASIGAKLYLASLPASRACSDSELWMRMSPEPEIDTLFPFGRNLASTTLLDRGAPGAPHCQQRHRRLESAMVSAPVGFHCLQRALRQVTTCRGARGRIVRCLSTDRQRRTPSKVLSPRSYRKEPMRGPGAQPLISQLLVRLH